MHRQTVRAARIVRHAGKVAARLTRRSLQTRHPVVDIVPFHLLTLALAEARGVDPDTIGRAPGEPLAEATGSAYPYA